MKIAYLYLVHQHPQLVRRVIDRLAGDDAAFFIHVDAKSDAAPFASLRGPKVSLLERRVPVYWGEFTQVEATLLLIREALAASERYDYFAFISGSDYPLCGRDYIHQFLDAHRGTEFINLVKMPSVEAGKPISRLNTVRFPSTRPALRLISRAAAKAGFGRRDYRKYLGTLEPYAGHTWWTLSRAACEYLSNFERQNPRITAFFRNSFAPDEMFFHTILGNSPFRSKARRNLHFEDWSNAGSHPVTIGEHHLAQFEAEDKVFMHDVYGRGEVLFARKFSALDEQVLQQLDALIARKENRCAVSA